MSTKRGYPLAVAILSFIALAIGCTGSEPGRTRIFVSPTPPGTAGMVVRQPGTQPTPSISAPATPTPVSAISPSTAIPLPGVNPTRRPLLIVTDGTVVPPPEPTEVVSQQPEPTADPNTPTPVPHQTVAPVPTPTLQPTATAALITRPTRTPTPPATPTVPPPVTGAGIIIECIFFDGLVQSSEADEYVQILNQGAAAVDLMGWQLQDVSEGFPKFTFPPYDLQPKAFVRVYT